MTEYEENFNFRTLKGYALWEKEGLTPAMEDYLEMICRMAKESGRVHVNVLAEQLHVKPSSASKMVSQLKEKDLVRAEKYGSIMLTPMGLECGNYLLFRHETVHKFLCSLNNSQNELKQTERIEHFLDERTVYNMEKFLRQQD